MKKIFTSLFAATAVALTVGAQQLPNNGFEEAWVDCVPWTSNNNTKAEGTTPTSWMVSNTIGTGGNLPMGNTTIAENVAGYNSEGAVKVENKEITVLIVKKTIPGYFGLGTPWATSTSTGKNMAGGEFGGIAFAFRPDALQFMYQSTGSDQPTVLAYTWNGKFVQKEVSGNIVVSGKPTKIDMVDRDRNVIGMEDAPQGGEVTEKGTLVALINQRLEATTTQWTKGELEFTYSDAAAPEKINVVFAAGDYFSISPVKENTLIVDDVKLIYFSRLKSLKVNGVDVPEFAPNTYEYNVDAEMPADASAIAAECMGNSGSAKAEVALDAANNKATVTVTNSNVGGTDVDGEESHVYTLNFKPAQQEENILIYNGILKIEMDGEDISNGSIESPLQLIPNADYTECNLLLPEKALGDGFGDIKVDNVKMTKNGGITDFDGFVKDLTLMGGGIVADAVVTGTCDAEGNIDLLIDVTWDNQGTPTPIKVTFNGKGKPIPTSAVEAIESDDVNAPAEYFTIQGYKVNGNNLANGFYIVRKGNKVSKIYVK